MSASVASRPALTTPARPISKDTAARDHGQRVATCRPSTWRIGRTPVTTAATNSTSQSDRDPAEPTVGNGLGVPDATEPEHAQQDAEVTLT